MGASWAQRGGLTLPAKLRNNVTPDGGRQSSRFSHVSLTSLRDNVTLDGGRKS